MNIAVYLGSRAGNSPAYTETARSLGTWIGKNGHTLVYGGSKVGLMGELATNALRAGGRVTGVIPEVELIQNLELSGLTKVIYTKDVAERRSKMIELAEAFVVLPGGLGTLDEISEVMSLRSLKLLSQPIVFLGAESYFAPFKGLFEHMISAGFSDRAYFENLLFTEELEELESFLHNTK